MCLSRKIVLLHQMQQVISLCGTNLFVLYYSSLTLQPAGNDNLITLYLCPTFLSCPMLQEMNSHTHLLTSIQRLFK